MFQSAERWTLIHR